MANKSKKTSGNVTTPKETTITRIKATDLSPVVSTNTKPTKKVRPVKSTEKKKIGGPLGLIISIGGYFKGAWYELRQVRWPNRRATWSLTAAVLIFTGFFVLLVVLLDIFFKYIFELILG